MSQNMLSAEKRCSFQHVSVSPRIGQASEQDFPSRQNRTFRRHNVAMLLRLQIHVVSVQSCEGYSSIQDVTVQTVPLLR